MIRQCIAIVIASEATQTIHLRMRGHGLLRRFALLRKRFSFVAGNDGDKHGQAIAKNKTR
jgi:hypothetical protein